ncbi:MAG: proton-conducting transporter membrane subunit [Sphingomonadaceae bacterium]
MTLSLLSLAPLPLLLGAIAFTLAPGRRPGRLPLLAEGAALAGLGLAIAGAVQLAMAGPPPSGSGLFAADRIPAILAGLVAFIGWVVVRYARRYLDGEAREGRFHGLLLAAVGVVLATVQAGSLALLVIGLALTGLLVERLLCFYSGRAEARRAARKFRLAWRASDASLLVAAGLFWAAFGTLDLAALRASAEGGLPPLAQAGVVLLALSAILRTAAFPVHGWLTEVMEAPTPVSALLHAGIVNSGGVVLILMAPLVQASPAAMTILVLVGGFSALFGAAVLLTQSAVKTALAWSTVAQMGFMLMQCGLGLWALALLHIVAHSLYKAHAFLASGGAVAEVRDRQRPGPVATPGPMAVARAFAIALAVYAAAATASALLLGPKSAQALAIGAILVFGIAYLVAQGLADAAPGALTRRTVAASGAATLAYFAFHALAEAIAGPVLPAPPAPTPLEWALMLLALGSFGAVAIAQALFPLWAHHPAAAGIRVHLANGLYVNALLDRLTGGLRTRKAA